MHNENIFLRVITYSPLFLIPLFVAILSYIAIDSYNKSFEENLQILKKNAYDIQKSALQTKIKSINDVIVYRRSVINMEIKKRVKMRVDEAYAIAEQIYTHYSESRSQSEIKEMIKTALSGLVWNDEESFIWIVDYQGVFKLAPKYLKSLTESSIIELQDANGRYIIQEEIALCRTKGGGFLWDTFTKPNGDTSRQYKQVAYVKAFGHFDWYFGSAEYLDTATKEINRELIETIKNIDIVNNNYIFLVNTAGDILLNRAVPHYSGKNAKRINDENVASLVTKIISALESNESAFLNYKWLNTTSNEVEDKCSYIQKVSKSDWILGSGFYPSDIDREISEKKLNLYNAMYRESNYMIYIIIGLLFISLIISFLISNKLKESFLLYKKAIDRRNRELEELNANLEMKVQERTHTLHEMAIRDELTELYNRKHYNESISESLSMYERYKRGFSLIMYDIDDFKMINDTYGHAIGDSVLIKMSAHIHSLLRVNDLLFRVGGEEFMLLLPNTTLKEASLVAQKIREEVEALQLIKGKKVTISLGVTEVKEQDSADRLFQRVDKLLYNSKEEGKNRVSTEHSSESSSSMLLNAT